MADSVFTRFSSYCRFLSVVFSITRAQTIIGWSPWYGGTEDGTQITVESADSNATITQICLRSGDEINGFEAVYFSDDTVSYYTSTIGFSSCDAVAAGECFVSVVVSNFTRTDGTQRVDGLQLTSSGGTVSPFHGGLEGTQYTLSGASNTCLSKFEFEDTTPTTTKRIRFYFDVQFISIAPTKAPTNVPTESPTVETDEDAFLPGISFAQLLFAALAVQCVCCCAALFTFWLCLKRKRDAEIADAVEMAPKTGNMDRWASPSQKMDQAAQDGPVPETEADTIPSGPQALVGVQSQSPSHVPQSISQVPQPPMVMDLEKGLVGNRQLQPDAVSVVSQMSQIPQPPPMNMMNVNMMVGMNMMNMPMVARLNMNNNYNMHAAGPGSGPGAAGEGQYDEEKEEPEEDDYDYDDADLPAKPQVRSGDVLPAQPQVRGEIQTRGADMESDDDNEALALAGNPAFNVTPNGNPGVSVDDGMQVTAGQDNDSDSDSFVE